MESWLVCVCFFLQRLANDECLTRDVKEKIETKEKKQAGSEISIWYLFADEYVFLTHLCSFMEDLGWEGPAFAVVRPFHLQTCANSARTAGRGS